MRLKMDVWKLGEGSDCKNIRSILEIYLSLWEVNSNLNLFAYLSHTIGADNVVSMKTRWRRMCETTKFVGILVRNDDIDSLSDEGWEANIETLACVNYGVLVGNLLTAFDYITLHIWSKCAGMNDHRHARTMSYQLRSDLKPKSVRWNALIDVQKSWQ